MSGPAPPSGIGLRSAEQARIGRGCIIGKDVYIDAGVTIGDNVKIQNSALVYHGATLEDGVFLGPQAVLTNDLYLERSRRMAR